MERVAIREAPGPNRVEMQADGNVFLGDRWECRLARGNPRMVAHGPAPLVDGAVWCEIPPHDLWIFPDA